MGGATGRLKLTKRVIDQADMTKGRHFLWDSELRGFGISIEPTGTKTYFVRYRPKGHGRDGARRFYKLGRHGDITPDEARQQAKAILGQVAESGATRTLIPRQGGQDSGDRGQPVTTG